MKREGLEEVRTTSAHPAETPALLRPNHTLDRGDEILSELLVQAADVDDTAAEPLSAFLGELRDTFDAQILSFVAVKFGLITSASPGDSSTIMKSEHVAARMLERFEMNPAEFRDAFIQVIEEEMHAAEIARQQGLQEFEVQTLHEIDELCALSQNPVLREVLDFAADLDGIFKGRACLFSYLEMRYSTYFGYAHLSPQHLAVQICLDYLAYREEYQIGIISDYENLVRTCTTEGFPAAPANPSNLLQ